ncbi:hypothetical protein ACFWNK_38655 [Streptomyces sp. NPDC058417]|uniref:hypothetical protein n=1 Tax=unclassified Streptomyces TaxID=2593676 RepID=UPI0036533A44
MKKKIVFAGLAFGVAVTAVAMTTQAGSSAGPVRAKMPQNISAKDGAPSVGGICVYRDANFQGPYFKAGVGAPSLSTGPYCFGSFSGLGQAEDEEEPDLSQSENRHNLEKLNDGISSIVNYSSKAYCAFTGTKKELLNSGDVNASDTRNGFLRIPPRTSFSYVGDEYNDAISSIFHC